jgi:hypothetical protein
MHPAGDVSAAGEVRIVELDVKVPGREAREEAIEARDAGLNVR